MEIGVKTLVLVLYCTIVRTAYAQDPWDDVPFIATPERPEVWLVYDGSRIIFHMEEEIEGDVYLGKLNLIGAGTPSIGLFNFGTPRFLGAVIRQNETLDDNDPNAFYLVITNKQDFETYEMQMYNFYVDVMVGSSNHGKEVIVMVENIDDNDPIIHLNTCEIPELYIGISNCTFMVTDIDGNISTSVMTFEIEGRGNEEELINLDIRRAEDTYYTMYFILETIQELDFDQSAMHVLTITAFDSLPNTGSATIVIQVIDMPNMPPRWVSIFAVEQFDEKTIQEFTVRAIDGDTQINKDIKYRLYKNDSWTFFDIDEDTGLLNVDPIDRDALKQEVFPFNISAYKYDNITWETVFPVVIIVNDINDNKPLPEYDTFEISIDEETFMSLAFTNDIVFEDIDLGINAQYNVELIDVHPAGASEAFLIIPTEGYQRQTFQITVVNASLLDFDYEFEDWTVVKLQIKAEETMNPEHFGIAHVTINLINWNDEVPIFELASYEETFLENVTAGYEIATVRANDRDVDDEVHYSIVGNVNEYLGIGELTGVITVLRDDAFDFQRQNQIIVQVRAVDTLGDHSHHTVFAQLTINLIDVNNKQPQIDLPRTTVEVEENVEEGHVITEGISGSDPDSSARITYSINWDNSYATKQGRAASPEEYVGCVEIQTVYPDPSNTRHAQGILEAKEIRDGVTIDFEEFEVLYLAIRLTDHEQEIGPDYTESMMAVIIIDLNDNAPQWVDGTLETVRVVREMANSGVVIGSVQATDIDGPLYNNVTYYIFADQDTPEDLVAIHPITGQITVHTGEAIDADTPPRHFLHYLINATDCCFYPPQCGPDPTCWNTLGEIQIQITDTNNKIPYTTEGDYDEEIWIYENATSGEDIQVIIARDQDRDEIYHTVAYDINYRDHQTLRDFFAIEATTGRLYVELRGDMVLDRDRGITFHVIYLIIQDNHLMDGERTSNTIFTEVTVHLLDVNDNAPELPPGLSWNILEDLSEGEEINPEIYAPDIDEPDTDNSRVNYEILSLSPADRDLDNYPEDLFRMHNPNNVTGHLFTNHDLKGYWGTWDIWIRAHDYGIPEMSTNETYQITVRPYNFHDPVFTNPQVGGQTIRLAREWAIPNGILSYANLSRLDYIQATDEDGLHAGIVTFEVFGNDLAREYFRIENEDQNRGTLLLTKEIGEIESLNMIIRATDQGTEPGRRFTDISITIQIVPTQGYPTFTPNWAVAEFTEFQGGLEESQQLPLAVDPKNTNCQDENCHAVYYYIMDGETADFFQLGHTTNLLRLTRELDRSQALEHTLRIAASNEETRPANIINPSSIITVVIEVKDHDPRPIFTSTSYTGGITITDPIQKEILIVHATHSNNSHISYNILWETMVASTTLETVASSAFQLEEDTGILRLNFQQQASMMGMFEFNITATDLAEKMDEASVTIFLVGDDNRVVFTFVNELTAVEAERLFIQDTISQGFNLICNVDWIVQSNGADGTALPDNVDVRVHFIENNVAVDANVVELKLSDIALMTTLRNALVERQLFLVDVNTGVSAPADTSMVTILQIILGVLAVIFGLLCVILFITYCITTQRLKRRIEGLTSTSMGSVDSVENKPENLSETHNRVFAQGLPGANRFAVAGTNPVWNEKINAPDFEALSETSGDSDLIGIEDDPQFLYDNLTYEEIDRVNNLHTPEQNSQPSFKPISFSPDLRKVSDA